MALFPPNIRSLDATQKIFRYQQSEITNVRLHKDSFASKLSRRKLTESAAPCLIDFHAAASSLSTPSSSIRIGIDLSEAPAAAPKLDITVCDIKFLATEPQ
jgi:hypothetical protein